MKSKPAISSSSRRFRLRTTFVVPFVLQIVAAVGLVGYLSFRNGQKAVDDLATQLMEEVGDRIDQQLNNYLATPQNVGQGISNTLDLKMLDLEDSDKLRRYFLKQFQQFPSLSWISLATEQPNYVDVVRYEHGSFRTALWNRERGIGIKRYGIDNQGNLLQEDKKSSNPNYDYRKRPWYQEIRKAGKPGWYGINTTNTPQLLVLSAKRPLYNRQNKFLGVLLVDYSLAEVNNFLSHLHVGKTGQVFILEQDGMLVASSTGEKPYLVKQKDGKEKLDRIKAVDSHNPLTANVAKYLSENHSLQVDTNLRQKFKLKGISYFLQLRPYRDPQGLNWLVVTAIPQSDFMAQIDQNTRTTILLCLGALGLAIAFGIFTTGRVTRPILRITQAAEDMEKGNLDQHVASNNIIEIEKLATSFNSMAGQLKESFETLEDKVKERTAELASANEEIIVLNEKLKEDNLRLGAELDLVRQMQQMILPNSEELEIGGLDIAGYMEPADEVGGDYYDVLHTDDVVTLGIGDVTGHGLESGILMLMAQTSVRTLQEIREADPVRFLDVLNRTLYKNVKRMNSEKSLTLALLNYSQGRVSISGQHEEIIVVRKGGELERVDTMELGFPIALDDDIADFINQVSIELQPGDGVVLYTDGIPEAYDIDKQQYGMERMCEVINQNWQLSAREIEQAIIADVRRHIGTQKVFDDITLLVFKRLEVSAENGSVAKRE